MTLEGRVNWRGVVWYCAIAFSLAWAIDLGIYLFTPRSDILRGAPVAAGQKGRHA